MSFRSWIVSDMSLVKILLGTTFPDGVTDPFTGTTQNSLAGDMYFLIASTGHFRATEDWEYGEGIRTLAGKSKLEEVVVSGGGASFPESKLRVSNMITIQDEFTPTKLQAIFAVVNAVNTGLGTNYYFDVANYRCGYKLPSVDLSNQVPIYMPGRTYIDDNNSQQTHTWQSYIANNNIYGDGTYQYVPSDVHRGYQLAGSVVVSLANEGYELLTVDQLRSAQPSE